MKRKNDSLIWDLSSTPRCQYQYQYQYQLTDVRFHKILHFPLLWSLARSGQEQFFQRFFLFALFCLVFAFFGPLSFHHLFIGKKGSERIKSVAQNCGGCSLQCRQCPYLLGWEFVLATFLGQISILMRCRKFNAQSIRFPIRWTLLPRGSTVMWH